MITGYIPGAFGATALASNLIGYFPARRVVTCCEDILYHRWQSVARLLAG
ncbi:hypothetical protein MT997_22725 [Paenibacillus sp. OVF10]|nr:hypothetical protein MT997_22725 [Paenibacillus sp. OVF10]